MSPGSRTTMAPGIGPDLPKALHDCPRQSLEIAPENWSRIPKGLHDIPKDCQGNLPRRPPQELTNISRARPLGSRAGGPPAAGQPSNRGAGQLRQTPCTISPRISRGSNPKLPPGISNIVQALCTTSRSNRPTMDPGISKTPGKLCIAQALSQ